MPVHRKLRPPVVALAALLLALASAVGAQEPIRITFLDVGQGDAVLVQSPGGKTALIDAGPGADLAGRLRALGIGRIDLLVASHAHADHIGGMRQVIRALPVGFFMDNGLPYTTKTYLSLMRALKKHPDIVYLRAVPRTIDLDSAHIRVLPIPPGARDADEQNDASVGLVLSYGDFRAFLSGDSERDELSWWVENGDVPAVTLLKAPHHGSANGFTPAFLRIARPEVVVISVGQNDYGHPMPAAVAAYQAIARQVYRTDRSGNVTILGYEDGHFEVRTRRGGPAAPYDAGGKLTGRHHHE